MTERPRLYPGHQHQWAELYCDATRPRGDGVTLRCCGRPGHEGTYEDHWWADPRRLNLDVVRCTVCGLQMPRNVAGLDGRMTDQQPQPEQETR